MNTNPKPFPHQVGKQVFNNPYYTGNNIIHYNIMSEKIQKNTLSFSCSKKMKYLRTPTDIWEQLSNEFSFTLDACASDNNHLLPKYYTEENSALDHDWTGEVAYIHPLFDSKIGRFVEKAAATIGTFVFLLPAGTHTKYFHDYMYKRPNVEIRFLKKPLKGFHFKHDDGSADDPNKMGYIKPLMVVIMRNSLASHLITLPTKECRVKCKV